MVHAREVKQREIQRAHDAGKRWYRQLGRREETVRRLRIGGPEYADAPERVERFRLREANKRLAYARAGITEAALLERRIGPTLDLDDYPPNEAARVAGAPVARVVELDDRGGVRDGFATGFLIAPNLMITNHHVFATASECRGCGIQFGYEKLTNGPVANGLVFALDTIRFFYANEALDFAIVGVAPAPTTGVAPRPIGTLKLIPTQGKILVGQAVSIIQHPDGGPKKYGVRDNELLLAPTEADLFLQYTTDTLPGSSGSPAFNKDWEVVALHHSGVPEIRDGTILTIRGTPWTKGMPDSDIHWIANEGVRISCICADLKTARVADAYRPALAELLRTFVDDLTALPAVQGRTEGTSMENGTSIAGRGMTVVVHGTANFYNGGDGEPSAPLPSPVVTPNGSDLVDAIEKKLRFDPDYAHRPGYKANFLGLQVPAPGVASARAGEMLKENGKPLVLKYHHYSLVMNQKRRLLMWSAVNVDQTKSKRRHKREDFGTDTWVPDPRVLPKFQIEDQQLYDPAKKFDRGHVVRRDDTAWGDTAEEEVLANSDSFHWTNCTPQHEQFNRAMFQYHGLWGGLENHIQSQAKNVGFKMSIFAGPVLDNQKDISHDFGGGLMKVPRRFWKVLCVVEDAKTSKAKLRAYAFILDQSQAIAKFGLEAFSPGEFETYQVKVADVAKQAGVTFDKKLVDADAMQGVTTEASRIRIESLSDVRI